MHLVNNVMFVFNTEYLQRTLIQIRATTLELLNYDLDKNTTLS